MGQPVPDTAPRRPRSSIQRKTDNVDAAMTFYHFVNCVALSYAPFHMTYKYLGLSEYGAFWKCVTAGFVYTVTQFAKMIFLATFFPAATGHDDSADGDEQGMHVQEVDQEEVPFIFLMEFLKLTVDLVDLFGLHFIIQRVSGKSQVKIMVAGLGWAFADFLLTRVLFLWVGARGVEFDWKYLQRSFESNVSLVHFLTLAALVWMSTRRDLTKPVVPLLVALTLIASYKGLILDSLVPVFSFSAFPALAIKAGFTALVGFVTVQVYAVVTVNDKY